MNRGEMIVYDSMLHSNMKPEDKSMIRTWFEKASGQLATANESTGNTRINRYHVISALTAIRQSLESNAASFGLGVLHADMGLDVVGVPMDLVGGLTLQATSILLGDTPVSPDLLNLGTAGTNSYSFRKGYDWMAAKKKARGQEPAGKFGQSTIHGEQSDDPIRDVAKKL
jgi:hypothetical protein